MMRTQKEYQEIVEQGIQNIMLPERPAGLYQPIRYVLNGGGKRLRPVLALATCEALGGSVEQVLAQAIAIEMFHNFTLLHDDVMDHGEMRRGRPTVHVKWDEPTAILSGDAMLTLAGELMVSGCDTVRYKLVNQLFTTTAMEVYEGQQYDMEYEHGRNVTEEEYLQMIRLKTAVLLGCACKIGAVMAGATPSDCDIFYDFGCELGMAFQLQDDLLDTYGDPIVFGKEIGGDILNDKNTWLRINALLRDPHGIVIEETLHPSEDAIKINRVRAVYDQIGLRHECELLIDRYTDSALRKLDNITLTPTAYSFFKDIAERSRRRDY